MGCLPGHGQPARGAEGQGAGCFPKPDSDRLLQKDALGIVGGQPPSSAIPAALNLAPLLQVNWGAGDQLDIHTMKDRRPPARRSPTSLPSPARRVPFVWKPAAARSGPATFPKESTSWQDHTQPLPDHPLAEPLNPNPSPMCSSSRGVKGDPSVAESMRRIALHSEGEGTRAVQGSKANRRTGGTGPNMLPFVFFCSCLQHFPLSDTFRELLGAWYDTHAWLCRHVSLSILPVWPSHPIVSQCSKFSWP